MPTAEAVHAADTAVADIALRRRARARGRSRGNWASRRARCASIWPERQRRGSAGRLPADVTDESLVARLFVNAGVRAGARVPCRARLGGAGAGAEAPGVNLMILWEEYRAVHPDGYAYSRFCQLFREFERRLSPTHAPAARGRATRRSSTTPASGCRSPIRSTGEVRDGRDLRRRAGRLQSAPMPRRPGRSACRTGSARMCACSASRARRRGCWCPTISRAASTRPRSTIPR